MQKTMRQATDKVLAVLIALAVALSMTVPQAALAAESEAESTTWAYEGITLNLEACGIGSVYYTSNYFDESGIASLVGTGYYTEAQLTAIVSAACTGATGYVEAPADATIGVSVYGSSTIYWYDATAAAAITSHTDALVLDATTGTLTSTVATTLDSTSTSSTWAYAGITLDSEALGIGSVYYSSAFFADETLLAHLVNTGYYTAESAAAIVSAADTSATGYVEAPADAVVGISAYGASDIFWYDADGAEAIVSTSDALVLDAATGTVSSTVATSSSSSTATAYSPTVTVSTATVKLAKTSYTYNGKAKKPAVKSVTLADGTTVPASCYTVSYKGNKAIGTAKAVITFKNGYEGSVTKSFTIKPATTKVKSAKSTSAGKLTVKMAKKSGGVKYQVRYKAKGAKKWKTVTVKGTTAKIKKLKSGKKYQVQVRTYKKVSGKTYTSAWSKTTTVKVK